MTTQTNSVYSTTIHLYQGDYKIIDYFEWGRVPDGQRKLYCIDEAIDLVEHDSVTVDGLKKALACIPEAIRRLHLTECRMLEETLEHFRRHSG